MKLMLIFGILISSLFNNATYAEANINDKSILSSELLSLIKGIKPKMNKDELVKHVTRCYSTANIEEKNRRIVLGEQYIDIALNSNLSINISITCDKEEINNNTYFVSEKPKFKIYSVYPKYSIRIDNFNSIEIDKFFNTKLVQLINGIKPCMENKLLFSKVKDCNEYASFVQQEWLNNVNGWFEFSLGDMGILYVKGDVKKNEYNGSGFFVSDKPLIKLDFYTNGLSVVINYTDFELFNDGIMDYPYNCDNNRKSKIMNGINQLKLKGKDLLNNKEVVEMFGLPDEINDIAERSDLEKTGYVYVYILERKNNDDKNMDKKIDICFDLNGKFIKQN